MTKLTGPAITLSSFNCPHCGAFAHQDWFLTGAKPFKSGERPRIFTVADVEAFKVQLNSKIGDGDDKDTLQILERLSKLGFELSPLRQHEMFGYETGCLYISQCFSCKKSALWIRENMVYPLGLKSGAEANEDLPTDIRADYDEARLILNHSPRGACALLRLCLQKLCKHVGEEGKNINLDIKSLANKGLPIKMVQAMDVLRVTGNEAVHPGTMDLKDDRQTALQLCNLLNIVAHHLITEPKNIQELYSGLPESKQRTSR